MVRKGRDLEREIKQYKSAIMLWELVLPKILDDRRYHYALARGLIEQESNRAILKSLERQLHSLDPLFTDSKYEGA